jgi:hypothetical protein
MYNQSLYLTNGSYYFSINFAARYTYPLNTSGIRIWWNGDVIYDVEIAEDYGIHVFDAILNAIDEIFTEDPVYGARRIRNELIKRGFSISRPTVAEYMLTLGLAAIYPKPDTSKAHPQHKVYPDLLRNLKATYPTHIWGTDIT